MTLRLFTVSAKELVKKIGVRSGSTYSDRIGNREIVGYGWNSFPVYVDRLDYPMPAVRFREDTAEIKALRAKEKGDWNKLTIHEKKALYRASFCQTFEEIKAPTGDWKPMLSGVFIASALALMITMWLHVFVYDERPESFNEANQKAQLKRMLDLEMHPIHGISSKWDYENKKWK